MAAPTVLLATCDDWPTGEPAAGELDRELAARGLAARWVAWDDPDVDWAAADLVAVRSTWDYVTRHQEFLEWAARVEESTRLLNGADVLAWNHDKAYLTDLGDQPVVPTLLADDRAGLAAAVRELGRAVVKPRVGAGGAGLLVVDDPDDPRLGTSVTSHPTYPVVGGPWVVQPVVESVRTVGEVSVLTIGGRPVSRVDKRPAAGEVRVNEQFGGTLAPGRLDDQTAGLAERAVAAVAQRFGRAVDYCRVDLMWLDGRWVVGELELIEPGLYLDVLPGNAVPFADRVHDRVHERLRHPER
jgi:glutathione synthase/RimK-type ligase-like ATP-grasp enzyme